MAYAPMMQRIRARPGHPVRRAGEQPSHASFMSIFEQRANINQFLAFAAAVGGAAAWFQPGVAGSDLWWHLASGRDMWEQLSVHQVDPFSYSFAGRDWMNHEWGWDVLYWGLYQIHPQAVAWFNLGVVTAIFSLVYVISLRMSGSALASGAALWLVAASSYWFLDIRPHLFTLLFVSLFSLTRERRWAPWFWPVLVVAWANLHSGFVFGVGAIGLYVLVHTLEQSIRERRLAIVWREWISVALCLLAMLANPYGYHILEYPLAYLNAESPFRAIIEWKSPGFPWSWQGGQLTANIGAALFVKRFWAVVAFVSAGLFLVSIGLVLLALGRSQKLEALGLPLAKLRQYWYPAALSIVTFSMAYQSRRFIPLFGVTAAPLAALGIAWLQSRIWRRVPVLGRREVTLGGILAAGLVAALLWRDVRIYPNLLERWTESTLYPNAALRYLKAVGLPTRALNYYNWGGYIMLHAPGIKLFIDGRANTLYGDEIYLDYLAMLSARPGLHARVARYPAEIALLPARSAFAKALTRGPRAWKVIYQDSVAKIMVPPGSPLLSRKLPSADTVLAGHPEHHLSLAQRALSQHDPHRARQHIEKALELNPLLVRAYGQLAMLSSGMRDLEGIEAAIARGLREVPRRKTMLKQYEGSAYRQMREMQRALEAYRQAVPEGPFSYPGSIRKLVRGLEQQVAK